MLEEVNNSCELTGRRIIFFLENREKESLKEEKYI